jgi:hypothetical protein
MRLLVFLLMVTTIGELYLCIKSSFLMGSLLYAIAIKLQSVIESLIYSPNAQTVWRYAQKFSLSLAPKKKWKNP